MADDDETASLNEAAQLTGLSTDALRLRWRRGTLDGYKAGRRLRLYKSRLPNIDRTHEHTRTDRIRSEEVAVLKEQLAVKDRQIDQLHTLLARLQERALPPPPAETPRRWWRWW